VEGLDLVNQGEIVGIVANPVRKSVTMMAMMGLLEGQPHCGGYPAI
jgi:ABC-type dipeptide/oligopeptide/nickel transport system ATPase component